MDLEFLNDLKKEDKEKRVPKTNDIDKNTKKY